MPGDAWLMFQPLKAAIKNKTSARFCHGDTEPKTEKQRDDLHLWESEASIPFILSGLPDKETWRRGAEGGEPFLYLLSCPGPSRPRRTECHRLRPVTSHSRSSDLPEPDPWSAAFLWGCPPQTLEEEEGAFHFTFNASVLKSHTMKTNWNIYIYKVNTTKPKLTVLIYYIF